MTCPLHILFNKILFVNGEKSNVQTDSKKEKRNGY